MLEIEYRTSHMQGNVLPLSYILNCGLQIGLEFVSVCPLRQLGFFLRAGRVCDCQEVVDFIHLNSKCGSGVLSHSGFGALSLIPPSNQNLQIAFSFASLPSH